MSGHEPGPVEIEKRRVKAERAERISRRARPDLVEGEASTARALQFTATTPVIRPARIGMLTRLWFFACVILPVVVAGIYLGFFAAPQYASSFSFVVQDRSASAVPEEGNVAQASRSNNSSADTIALNYMVSDYISSPQMVDDINKIIDLRKIFSLGHGDMLLRLRPNASDEELYAYWKSQVISGFDVTTGLSTTIFSAFTPQDSKAVADEILRLSERLVNNLGDRPRLDNVHFLKLQRDAARKEYYDARKALQSFRVNHLSIDPTVDVKMVDELISKLIDQVVANTTQMSVLKSQLSADAPAVVQLEKQTTALVQAMSEARARIAYGDQQVNDSSSKASYANQIDDYQALQLDLTLASQTYQQMTRALQQAEAVAGEKHAYLLAYVHPRLAETPRFPDIPRALFITFMVAFTIWLITTLFAHSVRDHF